MKKQVKWVRSNEEWYPTLAGNCIYPNPDYCNPLPDPAVRVSMMKLSDSLWRVCVWGGDDFGLEINLQPECKKEAQSLYDGIVDYTTQFQLKQRGFYPA